MQEAPADEHRKMLYDTDINALVDADRGLIGRAIYIDPQIYEQECRMVFTRCWMYLCHESQIPRPGDFCTAYIAEDPIIAWCATAGEACGRVSTSGVIAAIVSVERIAAMPPH